MFDKGVNVYSGDIQVHRYIKKINHTNRFSTKRQINVF
jgi:hypothetical protein